MLTDYIRAAGWEGPYHKGTHPFLVKNEVRLTIPNPHRGDINWSLTKQVLRQAGITSDEWDKL